MKHPYFYSFFMEEWLMQTRRCEYKRWKTDPDAETIWFSHIWNDLVYLQVVWSAADKFQVRIVFLKLWISIEHMMTQICRFLADSPHSLRKATWNCSPSFVPSRRLQMRRRRREMFRHEMLKQCLVQVGCTQLYIVDTCWYIVDTPHFVGFPFCLPTSKKRTVPFLTGQRCDLDEIDHSLLRVFPRKN